MAETDPRNNRETGNTEPLGPVEPPVVDRAQVSVAVADGLPDPLGTLADLLPGGRSTRGRPSIVYVPTRLDTRLLASLKSRAPTLVVLSGNAGDGKTAFLAQVLFEAGGTYQPGVENEHDVEIGPGRHYRLILDGSEDADDRSNDDLLDDALGPFAGPEAVPSVERGTLIAINKGRLLRFLDARRTRYAFLWKQVMAAFLGEGEVPGSPYVLVDLNDRTFVGPDYESSLMSKVIERLHDWGGWQSCGTCPALAACPVHVNLDFLSDARDGDGDPPARRLWKVFAAADLDDRVHITARHVVSQLAGLLGGGRRCADIRGDHANGVEFGPDIYLYNALFERGGAIALGESSALDIVLATYDPSERDDAVRGREMHAHVAAADIDAVIEGRPPERETYLENEARTLSNSRIEDPTPPAELDYRQRTLRLTHAVERRLHLHDGGEYAPEFALDTLGDFLDALESGDKDAVVRRLIDNLNAALGVKAGAIPDLLSPREYARGLRGRGFAMLIPADRFTVAPGTAQGSAYAENEFLETWPRALVLSAQDHRTDGQTVVVAKLVVPLLLFEVLARAGNGFLPASQTERAYMVRLQGFYRFLSEHPWSVSPAYVLYDNGRVVGRATIDGHSFHVMKH